jgi:hypothetical protein
VDEQGDRTFAGVKVADGSAARRDGATQGREIVIFHGYLRANGVEKHFAQNRQSVCVGKL